MDKEAIARQLLIDQIRRETLDNLKQYLVGRGHNGVITALKSAELDGYIFVIPDDKYEELFG